MSLTFVGICLAAVIGLYFYNNPLKHGGWFLMRRFINWFPLGMTYSFLYMGRFNLTVAKNSLGELMSNADYGLIFGAGTVTYGLSFSHQRAAGRQDRRKKGIIVAGLGASAANIVLGVLTYLALDRPATDQTRDRVFDRLRGQHVLPELWRRLHHQGQGVLVPRAGARRVRGPFFGTLISFASISPSIGGRPSST